jgi:hypothetical protein
MALYRFLGKRILIKALIKQREAKSSGRQSTNAICAFLAD